MLNAKNGRLDLGMAKMDYIRFGNGPKTLVMLPGVGDGLQTVKGMALPFAFLYRSLANDFTVYAFSRRIGLAPHTSTRAMAQDVSLAMAKLGLPKACILGVSQGGMIAQWLAIDHPEKVEKLVLVVSLARPNATIQDVIGRWRDMAFRGDYQAIMLDTAERSYSEQRIRQARITYGLLGSIGKPASFKRFLIQAESCITHDAYDQLPRISCPTLVIGGSDDRIVTGAASEELAAQIPNSQLVMYEGLSHGLYEEAPDFLERVATFCR